MRTGITLQWPWAHSRDLPSMGLRGLQLLSLVLLLASPVARGLWFKPSCETEHATVGISMANCSGRNFDYVPEDLHTNLDVLDLSNNALGILRNQSFRRYRNLEELFLRNCSLTLIEPDAFKSLNLRRLDLSLNSLNKIPEKALEQQVSLTHLYLNGNAIAYLGNYTLHNLRNLVELHLENNRIHSLHPDSLWGVFALRQLSLQHNALLGLDSKTLQYCRHSLAELRLYNNPWHCDCNLHWLQEWLTNTSLIWRFPGEGVPRCDLPSVLKGRPFHDVPLEEFACPVQMLTSGSKVNVPKGASIDLYCKFFAVPATKAVWFKDGNKVDPAADSGKYVLTETGTVTRVSILNVTQFQEKDMGDYKCSAANLRGEASISYTLRLTGYVEPVPTPAPSSHLSETDKIIIASVVVGLIVLTIIIVIVVCCVRSWQRKRRRRKEEIRLKVKDHLYSTAAMTPSEKPPPPSDDGLDVSQPSRSDTPDKLRSLDEPDSELQALYESPNGGLQGLPQPQSPGNGGNTYVSFGSELTEPEDLGFGTYSSRQDGSVAESTTPLLPDHYNHAMDSDVDPYDTRANSVIYAPHSGGSVGYWTGVHLPQTPGSVRSTMTYRGRPDVRDYFDPRYYPTHSNGREYADYPPPQAGPYQDYPYYPQPYTSPTGRKLVPTKKSASVGNLRQPMPPRKPPRIFHSRELVENGDESGKTDPAASIYEAITPGTPV